MTAHRRDLASIEKRRTIVLGVVLQSTLEITHVDQHVRRRLIAIVRILRERLDRLGLRFDKILTEFVGASAAHGPLTPPTDAPEVQLRVGVRGNDRKMVERFTREIAPLVLNGPPSVTGFAGGRPKVEEIVAYWPALIDKRVIQPTVEVR